MPSVRTAEDDSITEELIKLPKNLKDTADEVQKGAQALVCLTHVCPEFLRTSYTDVTDLFSEEPSCPTEAQMTFRTAVDKASGTKATPT